jgi:hypothetical protein
VFLGEIYSSKHYSKKEKSRFGRGLGPVVRQNTDEMKVGDFCAEVRNIRIVFTELVTRQDEF